MLKKYNQGVTLSFARSYTIYPRQRGSSLRPLRLPADRQG